MLLWPLLKKFDKNEDLKLLQILVILHECYIIASYECPRVKILPTCLSKGHILVTAKFFLAKNMYFSENLDQLFAFKICYNRQDLQKNLNRLMFCYSKTKISFFYQLKTIKIS